MFTISDPDPYVYPTYACPTWETTKTIFTSKADMDRLGWGRAKSEDDIEQESSDKGNPCCMAFVRNLHQLELCRFLPCINTRDKQGHHKYCVRLLFIELSVETQEFT